MNNRVGVVYVPWRGSWNDDHLAHDTLEWFFFTVSFLVESVLASSKHEEELKWKWHSFLVYLFSFLFRFCFVTVWSSPSSIFICIIITISLLVLYCTVLTRVPGRRLLLLAAFLELVKILQCEQYFGRYRFRLLTTWSSSRYNSTIRNHDYTFPRA